MAERLWGNYYIKYQLEMLGIPEEMVFQAMKCLPESLSEEKRIQKLKKKKSDRKKLAAYLASRGFPYELISKFGYGDDE